MITFETLGADVKRTWIACNACGADAFKVSYERDDPNRGLTQGAHYVLIANKRIYTISAETQKADFDKYAKELDAIVKSFKLIEAK